MKFSPEKLGNGNGYNEKFIVANTPNHGWNTLGWGVATVESSFGKPDMYLSINFSVEKLTALETPYLKESERVNLCWEYFLCYVKLYEEAKLKFST